MLCYLAYPIDQSPTHTDEIARCLADKGWAAFRPGQAYVGAYHDGPSVVDANNAVLRLADVVLAYLPVGAATNGVPVEISLALELGKPTAIITNQNGLQLQSWKAKGAYCDNDYVDAINWLSNTYSARRDAEILLDPFYMRLSDPVDPGPEYVEVDPATLHRWQVRGASYKWQGAAPVMGWKDLGGGFAPRRAHPDDSGWDLACSEDVVIPSGQFKDVPLGVAVEFPAGWWGRLIGRSSTIRSRSLLVVEGTIDHGYQGPLFAACWNLGPHEQRVQRGERLCQLVLCPVPPEIEVRQTDEFVAVSARGEKGFGSTGA